MNITYYPEKRIFMLSCAQMTYAFFVADDGQLINLYWGSALPSAQDAAVLIPECTMAVHVNNQPAIRPEYRGTEAFDFGLPCLRVSMPNGAESTRLRYVSHVIDGGELRVTLRDQVYPLEVELVYTTWGDLPLIGRKAVIRNLGDEPIRLDSAKSANFSLPSSRKWRLTHLAGNWGAEYRKNTLMLTQSRVELQNSRMTAAAAHQIPFFALDEDGASTETAGEVYFGVLHWSGDFQITLESQYGGHVSVTGGVSDFTSRIPLAAGESFETPMFTVGFSDCGFARMSEIFYDWEFDHILPRGCKKDKAHSVFPIIYNSWYPYEFSIDEEKLCALIPKAKRVGAELFVIDDGWMPKRVNERAGLGDWTADTERFPHGLAYIADECHKNGLLFGLWIEPEMVNPDSELYRAHPDWVISEPMRTQTEMRHQYILDMSRDEVCEWAIATLDRVITECKLDYLKWDMNRYVGERGFFARENGKAIKYMKNIRRIWMHMNETFPDLLLENCASGGGRADFGMVPMADRTNRSDNADPVDVMLLHEGFSMLFVPKLAGGAGNISPSPNHVNGRVVPLAYRANLGMTGSMSIGINLLKSSEEELAELEAAIKRFKGIREGLQDAYVYRIASAYEHPYAVFEYCRRDRSEFTVFAFAHGMHHWDKNLPRMRMRGLIPDAMYVCGDIRMSGAALMSIGVKLSLRGDLDSCVMTFKKE